MFIYSFGDKACLKRGMAFHNHRFTYFIYSTLHTLIYLLYTLTHQCIYGKTSSYLKELLYLNELLTKPPFQKLTPSLSCQDTVPHHGRLGILSCPSAVEHTHLRAPQTVVSRKNAKPSSLAVLFPHSCPPPCAMLRQVVYFDVCSAYLNTCFSCINCNTL